MPGARGSIVRRAPDDRPSLLVVHPGAELYGADRVLLESATALAADFDVTVVLPGPGPLVQELASWGLRVELCRMPVLRKAALRPRGAARFLADVVLGAPRAYRLLRRRAAAGVYVNTLTLPAWPLMARLARRPSVCHVHEAERSAPMLLRRGMAVCPVLADRVVFNSRFCRDVVTEVAPSLRRRSTVVYNAVRGPARPVPPRERLDGPLRLLFVGRLSPRKGPDVAVAVLRQLLDRGLDARLSVVGSVFEGYEWFETELRTAVAAGGLDDRVDFLGFQTAVWAHLDNADVVLVPSVLEESFGNAAVEAVLAARPVVVSDTSGLREAVAGYESAQSVVPGRPDLWADAVQRVAASWAWFGQAASRDAVVARERHAAARYRAELVDVVSALTARTADADTAPPPVATDALAG